MHRFVLGGLVLTACGGSPAGPPAEPTSRAALAWAVPGGFRSETLGFPLEFAPDVVHRGLEELRFAPGFFEPAAPGYWSYAFAWRTQDPAALDAADLSGELTAYFRGLVDAVDDKLGVRDAISVTAAAEGARFQLTAHVFDAFKTKLPLELTGWAERLDCGASGAVWRFVLAPAASGVRPQLDALAAQVACEQPALPPPPERK